MRSGRIVAPPARRKYLAFLRHSHARDILWILLLCLAWLGASASPNQPNSCSSLLKFEIAPSSIGLPTRGGRVETLSKRTSQGTPYCRVRGTILSVDPTAENIQFQLNLPQQWNRKAVQYGGAVFDGTLSYADGVGQPTLGPRGPTPLQRGYATFGSDSGHHSGHFLLPSIIGAFNASFGRNKEERENFSGDAVKKTHDAVVFLIQRYYGSGPSRTFFLGSSSGGHEALQAAEKWPEDYDGIMSGYPSWDGIELVLQLVRTSQALYADGGYLPRSKTRLLSKAVLQACDGLDGAEDGIVANTKACHFDPRSLLCTSASHKHCLTSQQLHTVEIFSTEQRTVFPLSGGVSSIPGYNVLSGADLTGTLGWFHHAEENPKLLLNSLTEVIGLRAMRQLVAGQGDLQLSSVDVVNGGSSRDALVAGSNSYDASDPDLSRFERHGGKLLLVHGTADTIIPTDSSVMYYERVEAAMGEAKVLQFMRLFLIPGFGHGVGPFQAGFDALAVLDSWNATGDIPDNLTVLDKSRKGHSRSRPLCAYPSWPKYRGNDDSLLSTSFTCISP